MQCPNCGQENQEGSKFCVKCGKGVNEAGKETNICCSSCGEENYQGALFCAHCGASIGAPTGNIGPCSQPGLQTPQPNMGGFTSSIALDIILTIITCGIYWFFWQARQMRALNYLLKEQRFNFVLWFFVSIITCFLFNVYYEYIMAQAIVEIQKRSGREPSKDLPVLSLVMSIFGLHAIVDAIQQNEINKFFEK